MNHILKGLWPALSYSPCGCGLVMGKDGPNIKLLYFTLTGGSDYNTVWEIRYIMQNM